MTAGTDRMSDGAGAADRGRVLVVSQLPPPVHGSTVMTRRLLDTVAALGFEPVLVERRFSRTIGSVGRPSAGKLVAVPGLLIRIGRAALRRDPGVAVVFLTNRTGSFLVDVAVLALLRVLGVRILLYVHTVGFRALAARGMGWRSLVRWSLTTGRVVTLGQSLVADVAPFVRDAPVVIPNVTAVPAESKRTAVGADRASGPAEHRDGAPSHVVYLSNLQPEKGAITFVQVARTLLDRGLDLRFTIAGAGSDEQVAAVASAVVTQGLEDRVHLRGPVGDHAKWDLLGAADVLLFPSTYPFEAQPLSIIEAMACGVPVVAYDTGGVRDLVVDGVTGRLVTPPDPAALADAVAAVVTGPAIAADMRTATRARFTVNHSPAAYRDAWNDLLEMPANAETVPPFGGSADFAGSAASFRALVAADWAANPRDLKSRSVLLAFRFCQWAIRDPERPRTWSWAMVALYRFWTEFGIGLELRPKTRVGGGLTIYHGYGLVVNDHTRIGSDVVIRNGVTIGHRIDGGPTPIIGTGVQLGAGAIVLGGVTIGAGARIGAGAVVLTDVPAGASAVGNPARIIGAA